MTAAALTSDTLRLLRARKIAVAQPQAPALSPLAWATANATIVHPARGRIPFTPYPYQARFLEMHDEPRRLILKARQIGFSQIFALEALYKATTKPESTILLVSRSQDLAVNLLRYCYLTYNNLRDAPTLIKENESEMGFANGSRIKSIPANRSTGRGFAASDVYLDEFAYAAYDDDIYQSVSPTVSQGGSLTIGSTPNGLGNMFARLYKDDASFVKMNEPWHHCPAYYTPDEQAAGVPKEQAAWYLRERPKYSAQAWASEYDCDFIISSPERFLSSIIWWDACLDEELDPATPRTPLVLAADAAVSGDTFALVGVSWHPTREDDVAVRLVRSWVPSGGPLDYDAIESEIRAICRRFNVLHIAYDPYQLHQMMTGLNNDGVAQCESFGQQAERLIADKQLLDFITQRRIAHDGNTDLRTHIDNADRKMTEDRKLRIVKRQESLKIDLAVALSMAVARLQGFTGSPLDTDTSTRLRSFRGI